MTSKATARPTFLPESEGGPSLSRWQGYHQPNLFGVGPVPASPIPLPASEKVTPTIVISGPSSSGSSASADLQLSLENKLRQALDENGSPEYALTWKHWDMQSGPPICALRAAGHRTSDSVSIGEPSGWPSPKAKEDGRTLEQYEAARLRGYEARKGKTSGGPASKQGGLAIAAQLSGWNTPRATDGSNGGPNQAGGALPADAAMAGWATPAARDWRDGRASPETMERNSRPLNEQAVNLVPGPTSTSSPASTARRGVLNPALSAWLMGFPSAWLMAGPLKASRGRSSSKVSVTP